MKNMNMLEDFKKKKSADLDKELMELMNDPEFKKDFNNQGIILNFLL